MRIEKKVDKTKSFSVVWICEPLQGQKSTKDKRDHEDAIRNGIDVLDPEGIMVLESTVRTRDDSWIQATTLAQEQGLEYIDVHAAPQASREGILCTVLGRPGRVEERGPQTCILAVKDLVRAVLVEKILDAYARESVYFHGVDWHDSDFLGRLDHTKPYEVTVSSYTGSDVHEFMERYTRTVQLSLD